MFPGDELKIDGEVVGVIGQIITECYPWIIATIDVKVRLFAELGKSQELIDNYDLVLVKKEK